LRYLRCLGISGRTFEIDVRGGQLSSIVQDAARLKGMFLFIVTEYRPKVFVRPNAAPKTDGKY